MPLGRTAGLAALAAILTVGLLAPPARAAVQDGLGGQQGDWAPRQKLRADGAGQVVIVNAVTRPKAYGQAKWRAPSAARGRLAAGGTPIAALRSGKAFKRPIPKPDEDLSTASITPSPEEAKLEAMRVPLLALARTMAARDPSVDATTEPARAPDAPDVMLERLAFALPFPDQADAAAIPAPRSVTFDLETGVKTVMFGDGVAVSDSFNSAEIGASPLRAGRP